MKKVIIILLFVLLSGCSSDNGDLISYIDAKEKIINNGAVLIDVRTSDEYNSDHIQGAVNIDVNDMDLDSIEEVISNYDTEIIVYCESGNRSSEAVKILNDLGYNNVYDLGSIDNWKE